MYHHCKGIQYLSNTFKNIILPLLLQKLNKTYQLMKSPKMFFFNFKKQNPIMEKHTILNELILLLEKKPKQTVGLVWDKLESKRYYGICGKKPKKTVGLGWDKLQSKRDHGICGKKTQTTHGIGMG